MQNVIFPNRILPYFLVAPQIILTVIFFFWPASQALYQSMMREDPFGLQSGFVGLANFTAILSDETYLSSLKTTVIFSLATAFLAMAVALLLATAADLVVRGKGFYRTMLIIPYAVAPALAGMLWLFMFNPAMGTLAYLLRRNGVPWDPLLNGDQAMVLVVIAPRGSRSATISSSSSPACRRSRNRCLRPPPSTAPAAAAVSGRSSSRFWRRRPSSFWSSTPSTPSSTRSASSMPSPAADRPRRRKRWSTRFTTMASSISTSARLRPSPSC